MNGTDPKASSRRWRATRKAASLAPAHGSSEQRNVAQLDAARERRTARSREDGGPKGRRGAELGRMNERFQHRSPDARRGGNAQRL